MGISWLIGISRDCYFMVVSLLAVISIIDIRDRYWYHLYQLSVYMYIYISGIGMGICFVAPRYRYSHGHTLARHLGVQSDLASVLDGITPLPAYGYMHI